MTRRRLRRPPIWEPLCEGTPRITSCSPPSQVEAPSSHPRLDRSALMTRLRFGPPRSAAREAELRKDDVLLVHAYEVPLLPSSDRAAAIARGVTSDKTYWTRSQRGCWYHRGCISTSSSR